MPVRAPCQGIEDGSCHHNPPAVEHLGAWPGTAGGRCPIPHVASFVYPGKSAHPAFFGVHTDGHIFIRRFKIRSPLPAPWCIRPAPDDQEAGGQCRTYNSRWWGGNRVPRLLVARAAEQDQPIIADYFYVELCSKN